MLERRTMQRFEIELSTVITLIENNSKEKHTELKTSNICAGGANFPTRRPLVVATQVALDIRLPFDVENKGHRQTVKLNGTVIYTNEHGMGIEFDKSYQFGLDSGQQVKHK